MKITIKIKTDEDKEKIEFALSRWLNDNFKDPNFKISFEDEIQKN